MDIYIEEGILCRVLGKYFPPDENILSCQIIPHSTADTIPASLLPSQQLRRHSFQKSINVVLIIIHCIEKSLSVLSECNIATFTNIADYFN